MQMIRTKEDLFVWGQTRALKKKNTELAVQVSNKTYAEESKISKGTQKILNSCKNTPRVSNYLARITQNSSRIANKENNPKLFNSKNNSTKKSAEKSKQNIQILSNKPAFVTPKYVESKKLHAPIMPMPDPNKKVLPNALFFLRGAPQPTKN